MTRAPRSADRWFADSYYSMQADKALAEIAESTTLPIAMRLYFLCASRANVWGHAAFRTGEMTKLLDCNAETRRRAMMSLKSARIAAPESTALCMVLSAGIWRRGGNDTQTCFEPVHEGRQNLIWVSGWGWETSAGEWHKLVRHPQAAQIIASRTVTRTETTTETLAIKAPAAPGLEPGFDPWAGYREAEADAKALAGL